MAMPSSGRASRSWRRFTSCLASPRRTATVVPFDGIVALHLEDTGTRRGFTRNRDLFLVLHYAEGDGRSGAQTFRMPERAGLAGMQIEDQEAKKKCGHLEGKRVSPASGEALRNE